MIKWLIYHYAEIAVWSAIIGIGLVVLAQIGLFILNKRDERRYGKRRKK